MAKVCHYDTDACVHLTSVRFHGQKEKVPYMLVANYKKYFMVLT